MSTTPGGRDALLEIAEPRLEEVLQSIVSKPPPPAWSTRLDVRFGDETIGNDVLVIALRGAHGQRGGYVAIVKPELRAGVLGMLALGDARLFERMSVLLEPARRPGAVLFADLEASTEAKTAPTPTSASTPTIARTTIMT